jgi:carbonic anhydrase
MSLPDSDDPVPALLERNRRWAGRVVVDDPEFFTRLLHQQSPRGLWIGCSDSRVPATQITDVPPGQIFVHRNIANQVLETDVNALTVVKYAVDVLAIDHIVVCGHYDGSGIQAALTDTRFGLVDL